jgi:glyoxylase-like metal-dependent hydrolase (beta-lactamase superfamily II)
MSLNYTVVSIGALSRNRFWNEAEAKRLAHSTTTLVRDETTTILVDPGLPEQFLVQRLDERTGLSPDQIDLVFLTNFRPVHRRALSAFARATWAMYEPEITAVREHLDQLSASLKDPDRAVPGSQEAEIARLIADERALLDRITKADDKFTRRVHLFPSVGVTPGSAGLLLTETSRTVAIVGDAVISRDYFEAGRVYEQVYDLQAAQSAFRDTLEIADIVVPGHDNVFFVVGR